MTTSDRIDLNWLATDPYPSIIGGEARREGRICPVVDPSTGEIAASWSEATPDDVEAAVVQARRTFDDGDWSRRPTARRAEVLEAAAARIHLDAARLASLESLDTGKAVGGAQIFDVYEAATAFSYAAGVVRDLHGEVRRASFPPELLPNGGPEIMALRLPEPVGVVCELLPWNAPLMTGSQRIAAALAAGCSIVAKPPEEAVISLTELALILEDCGLPAGVLNIVLGPGETVGEQLVQDPRVDLVSLTGSVETGRRVMQQAANNLTPVHLELGGKAPVIVFADADLEQAAQWSMMAAFVNMGEVCVAGSRLLVERPVYNDVVEAVAGMCTHLPIGDALDPETFIGPLITEQHADRVRSFIETALADGTAELVGAGSLPEDLPETFVAPTIMGGVDPGSALAQEEVFGPVLSALAFDEEDQALDIANGTRYGLNGTIFTGDLEKAFRVAQRLNVGEVNINHHFTPNMNGGRGEPRKSSGFSRTGIEAYTSPKAVSLQTSQSVAR